MWLLAKFSLPSAYRAQIRLIFPREKQNFCTRFNIKADQAEKRLQGQKGDGDQQREEGDQKAKVVK